jgi:hypothetical protein
LVKLKKVKILNIWVPCLRNILESPQEDRNLSQTPPCLYDNGLFVIADVEAVLLCQHLGLHYHAALLPCRKHQILQQIFDKVKKRRHTGTQYFQQ